MTRRKFSKTGTPRMVVVLALWTVFTVPLECQTAQPSWRSKAIIDVSASPYAKVQSVPIDAVKMGPGLLSDRMKATIDQSIPTLIELLEEYGVVDNFRRLSGARTVERKGFLASDSDLYKWMEAAAFALQTGNYPGLKAKMASLIDEIAAAQEPTGYLNTYYVEDRASQRLTWFQGSHELYCLGHLLQAGIAYYRATGDRKLLDIGTKFANYIVMNYGPGKRPAFTGHPELEMALVELYRTTGDRRYLNMAGYLLSGAGAPPLNVSAADIRNEFSGAPFTSRLVLEGHAVRAMYACAGATDYYLETGDAAYRLTLLRLWQDMVNGKIYVTGGVGSRQEFEAFGEPYDLPNGKAYSESCANIANMMWNWRMLAATGEARFADLIETVLYNAINAGMSLDGRLYCYRNPLESSAAKIRNPWYGCTCCPPNLERTFASLPGYIYGTSLNGVYVHLYADSALDWHLGNGTRLQLEQRTNYPWEGEVSLNLTLAAPAEFSLFLRIPAWSRTTSVTINGENAPGQPVPGTYFEIRRNWRAGDIARLRFDMTPRLIAANPLLREDVGKVVVARGPLVYCLEQQDQAGVDSIANLALLLGRDAGGGFKSEWRSGLLGGIVIIEHKGIAAEERPSKLPLYICLRDAKEPARRDVNLKFIPYYAWANRAPGSMMVWVPYEWADSATRAQGQ